ncbi:MAG: DegT/DnrJ/EryC1/StrS family aminotransferase [Spirochaetota bacterium]|nr:MAG: DegT/DnrJ/EryC1/StrS family aminotransferase [Spirochaetota bacterium]
MNIPFLDLTRQYKALKQEIDSAITRVVSSGRYIGGEEVKLFEEEMAAYTKVRFGVSTASGTDALLACLMAMGIKEGDEVITTPFTFISTAEVISLLGARPVFVDIDKETFNIDPSLLESRITDKTKCIIPVHIFGHLADMDSILSIAKSNNLRVLEDAAQAVGATYNGKKACSFGDAGCLSFYPSKNLGAYGDGGMVLTNDEDIAKKVALIKNHGSEKSYHHSVLGFNGRLDALQAAILRVKLRHLEDWNEKRRAGAFYYNDVLKNCVKVPVQRDGYRHVFNQYSMLTEAREEIIEHLKQRGIPTVIYYPLALHLQDVFSYLGYKEGDFPVTEEVIKKILSLPIFPELNESEKKYIAGETKGFFSTVRQAP